MIAAQYSYKILLRVGEHLSDLDSDFDSLWQGFELPCWLAGVYHVRLLTRQHDGNSSSTLRVWLSLNWRDESVVAEVYFFGIRNEQQHTIDYHAQLSPPPSQYQNAIRVSFHKDEAMQTVEIRIQDTARFLVGLLSVPEEERYVQLLREPNKGQLQYPYVEPEDIRYKEEKEKPHFHLAFQGGGSKGIAYLGAYKALADLHPEYKIGSVIGSSAGGMIALGIAAGAGWEELYGICHRMQRIPFDRTIGSVDDLTPEKLRHYAQIRGKLKRALHDYGLVCNEVFDLVVDRVLTSEVIEKIFEILSAGNESVGEMLKLEVDEGIVESGCCYSQIVGHQRVFRLLNYYGLLEEKLLSGHELEEVALAILRSFLQRVLKDQRRQACSIFGMDLSATINDQDVGDLAIRMTLEMFYELSGVEFTVTAVDLESQMLRFFNHKTTPRLPVSKAILMTGSFPIAFEAMAWQKQWGRYFVHYPNRRRVIDLTGHRFTDGGMLANFPIIFLDNEQMRPMYFSHKPNQLTRLFGFGLEQVMEEPLPEVRRQQEERMKRLQAELSELISKLMPRLELLYYQMKYVPRPEVVRTSSLIPLEEVPLVGFLYRLLQTYIYANDNLVSECFSRSIYTLPVHYPIAVALKPIAEADNQGRLIRIKQSLVNYYNAVAKQPNILHLFVEGIQEHLALLSNRSVTPRNVLTIKSFLRDVLTSLTTYTWDEAVKHGRASEQLLGGIERQCSRVMEKLKHVSLNGIFLYCDTLASDINDLNQICYSVMKIISLQEKSASERVRFFERFSADFQEKQEGDVKTLIAVVSKKLFKNSTSLRDKRVEQDESQKMDITDSDMVHLLSSFYHGMPKKGCEEQFRECRSRIIELGSLFLKQQLVFDAEKRKMGHFIEEALKRRRSNNVHLVFQSVGEYNKTAFEIFKLVKEYIFLEENTKATHFCEGIADRILKEDDTRTASTSELRVEDLVRKIAVKAELMGFLSENFSRLHEIDEIQLELATFPITATIKQHILAVSSSLSQNTCRITSVTCSSIHCFLGFLLASGFKQERIQRELEELKSCFHVDARAISEQFSRKEWILPFKCLVRQFQELLWSTRYNLFDQLEAAAKQGRLPTSLETIRSEFEASKETIMNSYSDILEFLIASESKANSEKSFEEYMASRMALNSEFGNFTEVNRQISRDTKELVELLLCHFYEQLRYLVHTLSPETIKEFLTAEQDPERRHAIEKGIVISRFLKCEKLKNTVQRILKEMNLPKDIRMKDFSEAAPRSLELTFTVVDITNKKITFINSHTFPEMPVWAAVISGSSFPILFPEVRTLSHWTQKIQAKAGQRYLKQFFSDGQYRRPPLFTSGNLLSSLPLELLTNRMVRESYFAGRDYTFLSFGLTRSRTEAAALSEFTRRFMTAGELVSIGLKKAIRAMFGIKEMIELNTRLLAKGNLIETYLLSHDNLILELYANSVLLLPVRLGTLEFHKLGQKVEGQDRTVSEKAIDETYYCTKEKFTARRVTYLEMKLFHGRLRIQFLSKERSNKDTMSSYNIEYKLQGNWEPVRDQLILVCPDVESIGIRFHYVESRDRNAPYRPLLDSASQLTSIRESEYRVDLAEFFTVFSQFCGIFEFPYSEIFNGRLKLVGSPSKSVLRNIQRRASIDKIFECRAIVQLFQTGLYCEQCSSRLVLLRQGERPPAEETCSKCEYKKPLRFKCGREYGESSECRGRYCFKCAKSQAILRTAAHLLCFHRHEFIYVRKNTAVGRAKSVPTRCDICTSLSEDYFSDRMCDIQICQSCCAQFTMD